MEVQHLHVDLGRVFGCADGVLRDYGMGAVTMSPIGRAWTAHCEGCRLTAYPDNGACSIGYGHRGVPEGTVWTERQAEDALDADLAFAGRVIAANVRVDLTQGQFDALADFVFNIGAGQFDASTLLRVLNLAQYQQVPDELMRWIYVDGEPDAGLKARREGEVILWQGGNPLESTKAVQAVS